MTTSRYSRVRILDVRPAMADLVVAEFTADLSRGWATDVRLPAVADASQLHQYRIEIMPVEETTHRPRRRQHAEPHFNDAGGCLCTCYRCVQVRLKEHDDHIDPACNDRPMPGDRLYGDDAPRRAA